MIHGRGISKVLQINELRAARNGEELMAKTSRTEGPGRSLENRLKGAKKTRKVVKDDVRRRKSRDLKRIKKISLLLCPDLPPQVFLSRSW